MKSKYNIVQKFTLSLVVFILISIALILSTEWAGHYFLKKVFSLLRAEASLNYAAMQGNFLSGIHLSELDVSELKFLPPQNRILAQDLSVRVLFWPLPAYELIVSNARLKIEGLETIIINCLWGGRTKQIDLYTTVITFDSIKDFLPNFSAKSIISAKLKNLDINVSVRSNRYFFRGDFELDEASYAHFKTKNAKLVFDIESSKKLKLLKAKADILQGIVWGRNTAVIDIKKASISSKSMLGEAELKVDASSRVASVDIDIDLKGTYSEPKLLVSSKPVLPERAILAMLATGRRWKSLENIVSKTEIAPDIALGLLDYFIFSKQANFITEKLGISDLKVNVAKNRQEIDVNQDLGDKMTVEYGVGKEIKQAEQINNYRLKGNYRVTDKLFFGLEQKTKEEQGYEEEKKQQSDQTISLEFQTSF